MHPTIGEALSPRPRSAAADGPRTGNALNFVRLLLAATVLVSHSFITAPDPDPTGGRLEAAGDLAVNGFFVISGYLIAGSRLRTSFGGYLWRRVLRIFPAFWVVLILVAFVFSPLYARIAGEHWVPESALGFVTQNAALALAHPAIAHTLVSAPYSMDWNIPLWTLSYEFTAYLLLGIVMLIPFVRRHLRAVFTAGLIALVLAQPIAYRVLGTWEHRLLTLHALRLFSFFAAGVVAYCFRDRIRLYPTLGVAAGLLTVGLHLLNRPNWYHLPLTYFLLWLGASLPIRLGTRNDISYGIYIYAFPMQRFVHLWLGPAGGWIGQSLLAFAMTVPWAYASWRLVEAPALRLVRLRLRPARTVRE
ncbi:acyltransferase family protein [Granulicoccus phenolivorans]|uniref:acyltransferase family protein n=1 Tax=Granulicoccus phenolivorans TaxID=266854 RepID=UPI000406A2E1|nr:acyltransferase [Granulicoccus phenolivorans]